MITSHLKNSEARNSNKSSQDKSLKNIRNLFLGSRILKYRDAGILRQEGLGGTFVRKTNLPELRRFRRKSDVCFGFTKRKIPSIFNI
ncbi:UNVERIFIED_CONTAM: hypothetical protein NCL1_34361 [Trichonephila clavipes]